MRWPQFFSLLSANANTIKPAPVAPSSVHLPKWPQPKMTTPLAPAITTQPASQTVTVGGSATFTVAASGTAPLAYQWRFYGSNLVGQTASSFSLANVQMANTGPYSVVVSNSAGAVTSSNALLTVLSPPPCVTPPSGLVSWWPGEGNPNDVVDGNTGVLYGGVGYTNGMVGQAFNLNGANGQ